MPDRAPDDRIARTAPGKPRPGAFIRMFGERVFLAHPAPAAGSVTIGRVLDGS